MALSFNNLWPRHLDLSSAECAATLRRLGKPRPSSQHGFHSNEPLLELEAYSSVVSAFRAQGDLTKDRRKILSDLGSALNVNVDRHKAEIRRALNDERLATVARCVAGPNCQIEWGREGRRVIPLLRRAQAITAASRLADVARKEANAANAKLPAPWETRTAAKPPAKTSPGGPPAVGDMMENGHVVRPQPSPSMPARQVGKQSEGPGGYGDVVVLPSGLAVRFKEEKEEGKEDSSPKKIPSTAAKGRKRRKKEEEDIPDVKGELQCWSRSLLILATSPHCAGTYEVIRYPAYPAGGPHQYTYPKTPAAAGSRPRMPAPSSSATPGQRAKRRKTAHVVKEEGQLEVEEASSSHLPRIPVSVGQKINLALQQESKSVSESSTTTAPTATATTTTAATVGATTAAKILPRPATGTASSTSQPVYMRVARVPGGTAANAASGQRLVTVSAASLARTTTTQRLITAGGRTFLAAPAGSSPRLASPRAPIIVVQRSAAASATSSAAGGAATALLGPRILQARTGGVGGKPMVIVSRGSQGQQVLTSTAQPVAAGNNVILVQQPQQPQQQQQPQQHRQPEESTSTVLADILQETGITSNNEEVVQESEPAHPETTILVQGDPFLCNELPFIKLIVDFRPNGDSSRREPRRQQWRFGTRKR